MFLQLPQLFQFSAPSRPGCANPSKTNAFYMIFRGFGHPWARFLQNYTFPIKVTKIQKYNILADFHFFLENHHFCKNQQIAETPVFPKEY